MLKHDILKEDGDEDDDGSSRLSAYYYTPTGSQTHETLFECSDGWDPFRQAGFNPFNNEGDIMHKPCCNTAVLFKIIGELGLNETSPQVFIAGILSRAFDTSEILSFGSKKRYGCDERYGFDEEPILKSAVAHLQEALETTEEGKENL